MKIELSMSEEPTYPYLTNMHLCTKYHANLVKSGSYGKYLKIALMSDSRESVTLEAMEDVFSLICLINVRMHILNNKNMSDFVRVLK